MIPVRRLLPIAAAALLAGACSSLGSGATASPVATTTVDLPASYRFDPAAITVPDGATVTWTNTNRLLDIEGYDGIKTGTTTAAGACLVASGRRGSDHLFVVVLGATSNDGRYVDARNLFRWAWRERGHS